ncbi:FAD-dependent oxidoreductase [Candidatus Sumerlaeota bacterium]|nr:FAD-dependent oxidoreductase [Candidatus Sumerlaeota bacterium]
MEKYDVITIGGGPAGITIARVLGGKMKVGIIRPEYKSMIYCAMPYALEGLLPIEKTFKKDELVTDSGADLIRGSVTRVSFEDKTVTLDNGEIYQYDKLIIATGADPILPPIKGVELKGVFTFKTQHDLELIDTSIKQRGVKKAVVVGAGAIGIELAQAFNHVNVECHLVDMAGSVLPNLIDADFSEEIQNELEELGIILHLNSKVTSVSGTEYVEGISLDTGEEISLKPSGIVVFAVGMKANTKLFENTPLKIGKHGIIVNNKLETNIKDVYAVGDCTQFVSGITGEVVLGKLATNAVPMARTLAKNLLGDNRIYKGFYNGAATKVGKYFVGGTGFTESALKGKFDVITGNARLTTIFPVMPGAKMIKMKLIADKNTLRILGGQIVGGSPVTDKIDTITLAIQHNLTARDLTSLAYSAQPYQSFFPANNLIVACAEDILTKLKSA